MADENPSAKQKQSMPVAVKRVAKIAELERNQKEELEEIAELQRKLALKTTVDVVSDLFAGVEIRIGEQTELIREDCDRCSYKLAIDEDEQKIQQDPPEKHTALQLTPRQQPAAIGGLLDSPGSVPCVTLSIYSA